MKQLRFTTHNQKSMEFAQKQQHSFWETWIWPSYKTRQLLPLEIKISGSYVTSIIHRIWSQHLRWKCLTTKVRNCRNSVVWVSSVHLLFLDCYKSLSLQACDLCWFTPGECFLRRGFLGVVIICQSVEPGRADGLWVPQNRKEKAFMFLGVTVLCAFGCQSYWCGVTFDH